MVYNAKLKQDDMRDFFRVFDEFIRYRQEDAATNRKRKEYPEVRYSSNDMWYRIILTGLN